MRKLPISRKALKTILRYDPTTGKWTWLVGNRKSVHPGDSAGCIKGPNGQRRRIIKFHGMEIVASRLAYFYMTGRWPREDMDHRDRDTLNDKWKNLRPATKAQNNSNRGLSKANRSGYKGVYWYKPRKCWRARIKVNGRQIGLGHFDDVKLAHAAYRRAAKEHHGRFARIE